MDEMDQLSQPTKASNYTYLLIGEEVKDDVSTGLQLLGIFPLLDDAKRMRSKFDRDHPKGNSIWYAHSMKIVRVEGVVE